MKLFVTGLSYRTAPVALRERFSVGRGRWSCCCCRLKVEHGLDEVVVLSTCNRVEIYGAVARLPNDVEALMQSLARSVCGPSKHQLSPHVYVYEEGEALAHLFAVASGLDSMVFGETEITGQVKVAYESARVAGATGRILNQVFQKALQTAKEIRTHTTVGRRATSVASVAVEVTEKVFGGALGRQTVMILGAGEIAQACARHLARKGPKSLLVCNRSFERAQSLAEAFGGRAVRSEDCLDALRLADIVITATGCPQVILTRAAVAALQPARQSRPLLLIDLSVPRNIGPAVQELDNVYLYDIDDLEGIVRQNICHRKEALAASQQIIARRVAALLPRLTKPPPCDPGTRVQAPVCWAVPLPGPV